MRFGNNPRKPAGLRLRFRGQIPKRAARHVSARTDLTLRATLQDIPRALAAVDALFAEHPGRATEQFNLSLAVDEVLANIVGHSEVDNAGREVVLSLSIDAKAVHCTIRDNGPGFDPTQLSDPDLTSDLADRAIGGLGWHFVRTAMSAVRYERAQGWNVLHLRLDLPDG